MKVIKIGNPEKIKVKSPEEMLEISLSGDSYDLLQYEGEMIDDIFWSWENELILFKYHEKNRRVRYIRKWDDPVLDTYAGSPYYGDTRINHLDNIDMGKIEGIKDNFISELKNNQIKFREIQHFFHRNFLILETQAIEGEI